MPRSNGRANELFTTVRVKIRAPIWYIASCGTQGESGNSVPPGGKTLPPGYGGQLAGRRTGGVKNSLRKLIVTARPTGSRYPG